MGVRGVGGIGKVREGRMIVVKPCEQPTTSKMKKTRGPIHPLPSEHSMHPRVSERK